MRSSFTMLLTVLAFSALSSTGIAGASPVSAPPADLEIWVGRWTFSGQIYKTPYSDASPDTGTADCRWTANKGYVVCEYFSNNPPHDDLSVLSYMPATKTYTHVNIHQDRPSSSETMTHDGNTWITSRATSYQGKPLLIRTTFAFLTAEKQTTTVQASSDNGQTWATMIEVTAVKAD
jgi:hypothetical protein